jgi:hypothetical protein
MSSTVTHSLPTKYTVYSFVKHLFTVISSPEILVILRELLASLPGLDVEMLVASLPELDTDMERVRAGC